MAKRINSKRVVVWSGRMFILMACALLFAACAPSRTVYAPPPVQAPAPGPETAQPSVPSRAPILEPSPQITEVDVTEVPESATVSSAGADRSSEPQYMASMHLVKQAESALAQGNTESAIPLLEQAIQVDVYNGEAFYNLARAWKMKGSRKKALEFASKAEILLQGDPGKLKGVYLLKAELFDELKDPEKANYYLRKADRL